SSLRFSAQSAALRLPLQSPDAGRLLHANQVEREERVEEPGVLRDGPRTLFAELLHAHLAVHEAAEGGLVGREDADRKRPLRLLEHAVAAPEPVDEATHVRRVADSLDDHLVDRQGDPGRPLSAAGRPPLKYLTL